MPSLNTPRTQPFHNGGKNPWRVIHRSAAAGESCSCFCCFHRVDSGRCLPRHKCQHRARRRNRKHPPPPDQRCDQKPHDGSQRHPQWLSRLQKRSRATAHVPRGSLLNQGVPHRPFAAHAQTRQQTEHQQAPRSPGKRAQRRAQRVQPDGPRHHLLAPIAVRQVAEEDSTDSRCAQRHPQDQRLLLRAHSQVVPYRDQQKADQNQIVEIEGPAQKGNEPNSNRKTLGLVSVHKTILAILAGIPIDSRLLGQYTPAAFHRSFEWQLESWLANHPCAPGSPEPDRRHPQACRNRCNCSQPSSLPYSQTGSGITARTAGHAPAFCAGDLPVTH